MLGMLPSIVIVPYSRFHNDRHPQFFYTDGIYKHIIDPPHAADSGRLCGCDASTAGRWPDASFAPDSPIEPNRT
jgi:hypothetical protein